MKRILCLAPMLLLTAGADLTIVKTSAVASDPQGNLLPKRVPGSLVDYTVTITNPNGALTTVNGVTFTDAIPANTVLSTADLGLLNSGPVDFGAGLSLLTYSFTSLGSTTDRLDFSCDNGSTWTCVPNTTYDTRVTNIRVRLGGNQLTNTSFTIRFRVKVK
jgi:uncharacterized repeat protein (TIGR01451 family)